MILFTVPIIVKVVNKKSKLIIRKDNKNDRKI